MNTPAGAPCWTQAHRRRPPSGVLAGGWAGHGDGIAPGAVSWLTMTLRPGRYELVCNLPGHYAIGMHTGLQAR